MAKIRRLVLDVMIPHATDALAVTKKLSDLVGVDSVGTMVREIDKRVTNLKVVMVGKDLSFKRIEAAIVSLGGSIHSIDNVVAGKGMVEDVDTLQD